MNMCRRNVDENEKTNNRMNCKKFLLLKTVVDI